MSSHIFISHSTVDDAIVKKLRESLEAHKLTTWVDSREVSAGAKLSPEIEQAIDTATHFIVMISPAVINKPHWVIRELKYALKVEAQRRETDGYRVIPIILPGVTFDTLTLFFDEEITAIQIKDGALGLNEALPEILTALGQQLPEDWQPSQTVTVDPVAELILELTDPHIEIKENVRRATATA